MQDFQEAIVELIFDGDTLRIVGTLLYLRRCIVADWRISDQTKNRIVQVQTPLTSLC